jgi:hypothetical protein
MEYLKVKDRFPLGAHAAGFLYSMTELVGVARPGEDFLTFDEKVD